MSTETTQIIRTLSGKEVTLVRLDAPIEELRAADEQMARLRAKGRPRKWASDSERLKAYRERKRAGSY